MPKSRPSPTPPLTVTFERGPTPYFHGRKQILGNFRQYLDRAKQIKSGGTIFLVQGAPGVGKTALLYECEKLAQDNGWRIAEINPPALWDPDELLHYLGKESRLRVTGVSGQVGIDAVVKADAKLDVAVNHPSSITLKILADGKKPLLLILDEAQTLGTTNKPSKEVEGIATNVLNSIHNGNLGKPVILLAAGLGTTKTAFASLGISRFDGPSFIELGALGKEPERAVIHDWLTKEGRAKGDPSAWIDAIMLQTHGWPQHILSYVNPALRQLAVDDRKMTKGGLNTVLKAGQKLRSSYYEIRVRDFDEEHRLSFAKLFADIPLGGSTTRSIIMSTLERDHGPDEAKELFAQALDCGILHKLAGRYAVPIPSMRDWLVSKYARERIKFPSNRSLTKQNPGMEH